MTRSHSSRVLSAVGEVGNNPRVVESGVKAAELANRTVNHGRHLHVVADIAADRYCLMTGGDEPLGSRRYHIFLIIREHDRRTGLCESVRRC